MFGGAGGYDGASGFAGGGFVVSQHDAGGGGGGDQQKRGNHSCLRHMTVRHLLQNVRDQEDTPFKVDGAELVHVKVLGKITHVRQGNTNWTITISDGTGSIDLQHWIDETEHGVDAKRNAWQPGAYVAAHGDVTKDKSTGNKRINAFNIRVVTDHNEITFHQLQAIYEHLHFTKGAGGGVAAGNFGAAPVGNFQQPQQAFGGGGFGGGAAAGPMRSDMDPCAASVLQILSAGELQHIDQGLHVNDIVSRLGNKWNYAAVKNALNFLSNEGHAFSTTDEDHYKAAL